MDGSVDRQLVGLLLLLVNAFEDGRERNKGFFNKNEKSVERIK